MKSAAEYLDEIKARHGLPSDYAAANLLNLTRSAVSKYRSSETTTHPDHFSPDTCMRVAALLDLDPAVVLLDAQLARAKTPAEQKAWSKVAQRFATAACAAGVFVISAHSGNAEAAPALSNTATTDPAIFIMLSWRRRLLRVLRHARSVLFPQVSSLC